MTFMKKTKEVIALLTGLVIITLFLYLTGIGCPIRFVTGISCPGCGITRAIWAAMHFQFGLAFYYHPLFWVLPMIILLFFFKEHIPEKKQNLFLWLLVFAYLVVYLLRLTDQDCTIVTANLSSGCIAAIFNKILKCFV